MSKKNPEQGQSTSINIIGYCHGIAIGLLTNLKPKRLDILEQREHGLTNWNLEQEEHLGFI